MMHHRWDLLIVCLAASFPILSALRATVFGASGGAGQLICNKLLSTPGISSVRAVSRNVNGLKDFELLQGCEFLQADALDKESLPAALDLCDILVLNLGTTAFPTKKWDGGNDPLTACYKTVENILQTMEIKKTVPKRIVLLSSIGVERADQFPFKILNSFGVLDAKRDSEKLLFEYSDKLGFEGIVVRPGRLVGAPFTNFDLAKALNLDQGANKGIVIDTRDVLAGDMERSDVATAIAKLLTTKLTTKKVLFSIINKPGDAPTDMEWGRLFSLFTVANDDAAPYTRQS
jgi:uncharacterized protein YbjT (DUF2867 family)